MGERQKSKEKGKRIGPLTDVTSVQRELRRVYRASRRGEVETLDLSRFVAALREMRSGLVAETFEARIAALEETAVKREADGQGPGWKR